MTEITADDVCDFLSVINARCEMARFVGGISHLQVVESGRKPDGYWFDDMTSYWIPVGVSLDGGGHA